MKIAGILLLACASAQNVAIPATAQTANFTRPLRIDTASCPVDLRVQHADSLAQSRALYGMQGDVLSPSPAQRVRLTVTNLLPQDVASAQITAHGFSSKGRVVTLLGERTFPDLTKKVALDLHLQGSRQISQELSLTGFSEVAFIHVDSVTYVDGTTWRAASAGSCSVTPDLFMPVIASR